MSKVTVEILGCGSETGVREYANMADALKDTARIIPIHSNQIEILRTRGFSRYTWGTVSIISHTVKEVRVHNGDILALLDAAE